MKWVGQNIYDIVSKFRQKVFVENSDLEIRTISGQPTLELSAWSETATSAPAGRLKFLKSGSAGFDTFTAGNLVETDSLILLADLLYYATPEGEIGVMESLADKMNTGDGLSFEYEDVVSIV